LIIHPQQVLLVLRHLLGAMLPFVRQVIAKPAFSVGGSIIACASMANEDSSSLQVESRKGMMKCQLLTIAESVFPLKGASAIACTSITNYDSSEIMKRTKSTKKLDLQASEPAKKGSLIVGMKDIPSRRHSDDSYRQKVECPMMASTREETHAVGQSQQCPMMSAMEETHVGQSLDLAAEVLKIKSNALQLCKQWNSSGSEQKGDFATVWPTYRPKPEDVASIRSQLEEKQCKGASALSASGTYQLQSELMSPDCMQLMFDLATAQTFSDHDSAIGFSIYKRLGAMGHTDSVAAVSTCLAEGIGVIKDKAESVRWMIKAAELGNPQGKFMLADCLLERAAQAGPEPSDADQHAKVQALSLLLSAAESGHGGAQEYLSWMLDGSFHAHFKKGCETKV
jgi:hypothetical protein